MKYIDLGNKSSLELENYFQNFLFSKVSPETSYLSVTERGKSAEHAKLIVQ